jgi:dihydrodipicolinate synthase/N-acetylneuraminate lyase
MFDYLTGIYNITPTPFKADGSLDEPSLRKLTECTRGTGVDGMTILGVTASARVRSPFTPVDADTLADRDDILARLQLLTAKV